MYKGSIPAEDIDRDAQHLEITPEQFIDTYLEKEEYDMNYQTKHKPCDFLQEDGNCKLGDCKPDSCKKYPYTDQPERLSSLLSVLDIGCNRSLQRVLYVIVRIDCLTRPHLHDISGKYGT